MYDSKAAVSSERGMESGLPPAPVVAPDEYRIWGQVAVIENDRYCLACGYNLRTQSVRRQPATDLLVARCPECAKFTAVSEPSASLRPWARRLISVAVFVWLGFLLVIAGWAIGGSVAMNIISLEERMDYSRVAVVMPASPPALAQAMQAAGAQAVQLGGGSTMTYSYSRQIAEPTREYWAIKFGMIGLAMLIAFVAAMIVLVALPHWPRLVYLAAFCLAPIIPAAIAWLIWREDKPDFIDWGTVEIAHTWLGQVLAGLAAGLLGRRPVRLLALIFLPSRLRAALAYLWIVDGKTPPVAHEGQS